MALHGREETKVNIMPEVLLREIQKLEVRLEDLREEDAFVKEDRSKQPLPVTSKQKTFRVQQ